MGEHPLCRMLTTNFILAPTRTSSPDTNPSVGSARDELSRCLSYVLFERGSLAAHSRCEWTAEKIFEGVMHFIRERAARTVVTLLVIFVLPAFRNRRFFLGGMTGELK
jgi:hypothetical protein